MSGTDKGRVQGGSVRIDRRDRVAVVWLSNPPMNLLDARLRTDLAVALEHLSSDDDVDSVVLAGSGGHFCGGLDLRELDAPLAAPQPRALANQVEALGKPVVAALSGTVAGAGLELALAATARVARADAQLGLSDLVMGLTPCAGATQRLPRLLGAKAALDLMLSAQAGFAAAGARRALCDALETGDPVAAAVSLAASLADAPRPMTRERDDGLTDPAAYQAAVVERRALVAEGPHPAARDIVACVEAALLLPFEAGLAMEEAVFDDAVASSESRALRHMAFAERRAINMPETKPGAARPLRRIGLVGGGATAAGIAARFLGAGLEVVQFDRSEAAVAAARSRVEAQADAGGRQGDVLARWQGTDALGDLAGCDLILEAVAEVPQTKTQVFAALGAVAGPQTILATQSGLLEIAPMATAAGAAAGRVCGFHLHPPFAQGRLAEVIPGPGTEAWVVASLAELARGTLGRIPVRSGTGGGGLGEWIMAAARDAGIAMLAEGVPLERIDRVVAEWGMAPGLFRQIDMVGCDVVLARGRLLARGGNFPKAHLAALERLVAQGRTGRTAGKGFYAWEGEAQARVEDGVFAHLFGGATPPVQRLPEAEIRLRIIAAMANEGARMLRAGMVLRPSDIDVALVLGHRFPRWRGGPMKAADLVGLFEVLRALKRLAPAWPELYEPEPGIAALIRNGENFEALNGVGRNRRSLPD